MFVFLQFNKISNQRKQEIERAREERIAEEKRARRVQLEQEEKQREAIRIANENWEKYLEDVKTGKFCEGSYAICIGRYSGPIIPSSVQTPTPCNPLDKTLQKTTRSGKTY